MIELPIKVRQKFLSDGVEVEIVCVTGKIQGFPVIDDYGDCYTVDGLCNNGDECDLQPIPATIEEGVEFSGPEYAEAFRELVEAGREFEYYATTEGRWRKSGANILSVGHTYRLLPTTIAEGVEFRGEQYRQQFNELIEAGRKFETTAFSDYATKKEHWFPTATYRLVPQHRDADGNLLTVGDRVKHRNSMVTVSAVDGQILIDEFGNRMRPSDCRKLTTRTRPLCADDLMQHRTALFWPNVGHKKYPFGKFDESEVRIGEGNFSYEQLVKDFKWSPSADQPWQPCEVTEEVLA